MATEVWVEIVGHEDYEVSSLGRVRSKSRRIIQRGRWGGEVEVPLTGRVLKFSLAGAGYAQVCLGAGPKYYIHRLVAHAFCANSRNHRDINHLNGLKLDNRADNLAWCSKSENSHHATHVLGIRSGQFVTGGGRHA
jgi:hypothetical protein